MPNTRTRTQGANARSSRWDDYPERQPQTRGNWLPLDELTDEELFDRRAELRAMPASRRSAANYAPAMPPAEVRPDWLQALSSADRTAVHPTRAAQQRQKAQPQARGIEGRLMAMIAGAAILALALYVVLSMAVEWAQVKLDDLQYGRPRTMQIDAYVGHGEAEGVPSHFVAMNLNRRVTILQMPGGDSTKVNTIIGPYLFGAGEDLTPVLLDVKDVNADGYPDLLVSVESEQLIYLNDGTAFKLISPEERAALQKQASHAEEADSRQSAAGPQPQEVEEAGK